jgi:hypothetical protein
VKWPSAPAAARFDLNVIVGKLLRVEEVVRAQVIVAVSLPVCSDFTSIVMSARTDVTLLPSYQTVPETVRGARAPVETSMCRTAKPPPNSAYPPARHPARRASVARP